MAYGTVVFEHPMTKAVKEAPIGFSWTMLFFGFFPPLFRGDIKWMLITFVLVCLTFGVSDLLFCFMYNRLYVKDLVSKGFKAKNAYGGVTLDSASAVLKMSVPRLEEIKEGG